MAVVTYNNIINNEPLELNADIVCNDGCREVLLFDLLSDGKTWVNSSEIQPNQIRRVFKIDTLAGCNRIGIGALTDAEKTLCLLKGIGV